MANPITPCPRELGKKAYHNNINAPCLDPIMMDWLKDNTSGEVGSGLDPLKQWLSGWNAEHFKVMKAQFPEMYN